MWPQLLGSDLLCEVVSKGSDDDEKGEKNGSKSCNATGQGKLDKEFMSVQELKGSVMLGRVFQKFLLFSIH